MATEQQAGPDSLGAFLRHSPQRFEFIQALLILQRERPACTPLGTGNDPRQEVVHLRGPLLPEFSPSEISSLRVVVNQQVKTAPSRFTLHTQVFGLGGPDGPLPYAYQEWLQQRARLKDYGTVAFLDLFQHRLLSLLYRVHCKYRVALPYTEPQQSPVYQQLKALCGLTPGAPHPTPGKESKLQERALIARAGLLANGRRSLSGFKNLLTHYFKLQSAPLMEDFQGDWLPIPQSEQSVLGHNRRNLQLGRNALCGASVWDEHVGIRISIGPLDDAAGASFMPGGSAYKQLCGLVGFYFGADLRCTLRLSFLQVSPMVLRHDHSQQANKLGIGSWLNRRTRKGRYSLDLQLPTQEQA